MKETITLYSEIIEEIVNGTLSRRVIEVREPFIIEQIIRDIKEIVQNESGDATKNVRLPINLLLHVDNDDEAVVRSNTELPEKYRDYFFTSNDKAMEIINHFVLDANDVFERNGLKASITTAKVAARLRAQLLHALTDEKFENAHLELVTVNNGIITFNVENPEHAIEHLQSLI